VSYCERELAQTGGDVGEGATASYGLRRCAGPSWACVEVLWAFEKAQRGRSYKGLASAVALWERVLLVEFPLLVWRRCEDGGGRRGEWGMAAACTAREDGDAGCTCVHASVPSSSALATCGCAWSRGTVARRVGRGTEMAQRVGWPQYVVRARSATEGAQGRRGRDR
jgi:hypothetical protein